MFQGHVSPYGKQPGGDTVHIADPSAVVEQDNAHGKGRDDPGEILPAGPELLHGSPELGGHSVKGAGKTLQFRFGHEGEADFLSLGNFSRRLDDPVKGAEKEADQPGPEDCDQRHGNEEIEEEPVPGLGEGRRKMLQGVGGPDDRCPPPSREIFRAKYR